MINAIFPEHKCIFPELSYVHLVCEAQSVLESGGGERGVFKLYTPDTVFRSEMLFAGMGPGMTEVRWNSDSNEETKDPLLSWRHS